jgi:hypothetical protein
MTMVYQPQFSRTAHILSAPVPAAPRSSASACVRGVAGTRHRPRKAADPGLAAALAAGGIAPIELPEPWHSILAYADDTNAAPGHSGFAPVTATLPELDGIRFVLDGLRSGPDHAYLRLVTCGNFPPRGGLPPGMPTWPGSLGGSGTTPGSGTSPSWTTTPPAKGTSPSSSFGSSPAAPGWT